MGENRNPNPHGLEIERVSDMARRLVSVAISEGDSPEIAMAALKVAASTINEAIAAGALKALIHQQLFERK